MTGILNLLAGALGRIPSDDYFEYTTLLLPGNGTNGAQNNTFLDSGTANGGVGFTITRNGNTTQGTFSPFSQTGWGNYFDGTGDYLATPTAQTPLTLNTDDFTLECWYYLPAQVQANTVLISSSNSSSIANALLIQLDTSTNAWGFYINGTNLLASASGRSATLNTWQHIAVTRSGSTFNFYLNGVAATGVSTSSASISVANWLIGYWYLAVHALTGYISNLRIVKGVVVYTGNFTPPTSPLAATQSAGTNISAITGTQTSLLTCQSNRFIDNSTNNFTITRNGDTRVVAFSPFNPTASWSAATNGGSGYFDGNGDYLTAPSNAAFAVGSVFTIEFWLYPISAGANPVYIYLNENTGSLQFGLNGGTLSLAAAGVAWRLTGSKGPVTNAWNHCVLVRSGTGTNQTSIFLNGERIANGTVTDAWTTDVQAIIQSTLGTSYLTTGYMSGVRIVKGTAVYDPTLTTLTVPTAPLTAITNTSLLLNFTNAGIYDATSKNDLETVGNAQISTAISAKWGSGSMYFDGTGDWLLSPASTLYAFNTGDFTIEGWVYIGATPANACLFDTRNGFGTGGFGVFVTNGTGIAIYTSSGTTIFTATSCLTTSTWQHLAITRNGTNFRVFVNGTQISSTVTNSANMSDGYLIIANALAADRNYPFTGYIQDLRITKGYARYTANFTPPTAAFPTL